MMKKIHSLSMALILTIIAISCTSSREKSNTAVIADIPVCGTVQFSDGCSSDLDEAISYGLALVHHMTYDEAELIFTKVIEKDPSCFWGHWGKSLTYIHPLWNDPPGEARFTAGQSSALQAMKLAKNEKEISYAKVLNGYYESGLDVPEKERLMTFHKGWMTAHNMNPADLEAKAFYALSLIAIADPSDKTLANQIKAGGLAEEVMKEIADHPGAFHYIIHAYDVPGLSDKALEVANKYGTIAPEIPHTLHMPSHIFTRLGMWNESIEWNKRSAAAAVKTSTGGVLSMHYFHALDYMMYAHLQQGEDRQAISILDEMKKLTGPFQPHGATAYTLAAVESRYFLERQDWEHAASMELPDPAGFQWEKYPEYEALKHFAIGLGAARNGSRDAADKSLRRLGELQSVIKVPYWSNQVDIQKNIINAWLLFGNGSKNDALKLMKAAADQEWATQKHPITPGELLPARELLGDMLQAMGRAKEALEQYEMSLERSPRRLNTLYGAAQSAALSGDKMKAKMYYEEILKLTSAADDTMLQRKKSLEYLATA